MKESTTLESVIEKVHQVSANHHDLSACIEDMGFDSLKRMWIAGQQVEILPSAQRLFANRLRIPYSYLHRCPSWLQAESLNHFLTVEQKKRDTLYCRFDGNKLRAVFTERFTPIDNLDCLSKMLEYGFDPEAEVHCSLDPEMMVVNVPDNDRLFQLSEKDKIVPGISIANSEVGVLALTIQAYALRLVCTNGMIAKTAVDARYKHISRRVMDEFPLVLGNVVSQSSHFQNRFQISVQTPVDNPESTIDTFSRQFQIPQMQTEIVKQAFYLEQGATMFHIIQAFTRAAQDISLSAADSYRMEKAGGTILSMVKS